MQCLEFYIPYETVDDIPMEEFKNLHREYWECIAENGLNYKPDIRSSITGRRLDVYCGCFACEYSKGDVVNDCCPLALFDYDNPENFYYDGGTKVWKGGCTGSPKSPYRKWLVATDPDKLREYALECAHLEWRDKHEN